METVEDDLLARTLGLIDRAHKSDTPFFLWHNTTRMHVWTRLSERWRDKTGLGVYADGMQELDWVVGELLKKLDDLGIADNTIVVFTSDNGAEKFSWPDGGTSPFRGEKGLGWEGGFRAPFLIRWPGKIPAGQILNGIMSLEDVVPTIMAAAGVPNVKEQLLEGYQAGDKHFRVHLDGYNQLPYLTGEVDESPRREFFYYGERDLYAIRYNNREGALPDEGRWFAVRSFNRPCPNGRSSIPASTLISTPVVTHRAARAAADHRDGLPQGRSRRRCSRFAQRDRDEHATSKQPWRQ